MHLDSELPDVEGRVGPLLRPISLSYWLQKESAPKVERSDRFIYNVPSRASPSACTYQLERTLTLIVHSLLGIKSELTVVGFGLGNAMVVLCPSACLFRGVVDYAKISVSKLGEITSVE